MRDSLAIALLCVLAALPILVGAADSVWRWRARHRRSVRRRFNLGYQSAWSWVFGRARHRRLTDQRRRERNAE